MATSIKEILGDLYTPEIESKLNAQPNIGIYIWDKEEDKKRDEKSRLEPIPKFKVNEMVETHKTKSSTLENQVVTLENQAKEYDKQLKELKKAADGNGDLVKQIEDLQKTNKEVKDSFEVEKANLSKKELELKKVFALKENLLDAGVNDGFARDLLTKNFDIDKLEVGDDGKIKGFEELLKPIKENTAFQGMFGQTKPVGQQHIQGNLNINVDSLETQLESATKTGNTIQIVSLKRQISERDKAKA